MAIIAGQGSDHSFVLPRLRQSFSHAMFLFRFYVFGEWTLNKNAVIIKIIRCVARPPQSAFNVLHGPLGVLWNTSVFVTLHGTREQSFVCAVSAAANISVATRAKSGLAACEALARLLEPRADQNQGFDIKGLESIGEQPVV